MLTAVLCYPTHPTAFQGICYSGFYTSLISHLAYILELESPCFQTVPVTKYYAKKGVMRTVNASLDSTSIFWNIRKIFDDMKESIKRAEA